MTSARVSPRTLAARVGVSAKTVERWLADPELVPHARNRADACQALGVEADVIWPQAVRQRVKAGNDREIVQSFPYRSACPSPLWHELVAGAQREIFFAGYTNYFVWTLIPACAELLAQKSNEGVRVRFLLGDPDGEVTRQREQIEGVALTVSTRVRITLEHLARLGDKVEARYSAPEDAMNHVSLSVFRFDDQALVTPHLARLVGHDSPMMHLRRHGDGGMFDRFAEHAEELWGRGTPAG